MQNSASKAGWNRVLVPAIAPVQGPGNPGGQNHQAEHPHEQAGIVLEAPEAKRAMEGPEVVIAIDLGSGAASATVFGCDLSYDYVRINAEYST